MGCFGSKENCTTWPCDQNCKDQGYRKGRCINKLSVCPPITPWACMCKTGLCSHPIIENEILENGTSFDQTTVYTCKKYNRRAVTVTSPPHNYLQEVLDILTATHSMNLSKRPVGTGPFLKANQKLSPGRS